MKKGIFLTIKKSHILISLFLVFVIIISSLTLKFINVNSPSKINNLTVVLDAGHGGIDGGCEGKYTKQKESDLNLDICLKIKNLLQKVNVNVVLTRQTKDGLYDEFSKNKKQSEMKKRESIINSSNASAMVSIHANSFSNTSAKGAQVFYRKDNENGKILAENIKNSLISNIKSAKRFSLPGDYYVLNCTEVPSVLVEVGYLSNKEEDELLLTENYRNKLAYSIYYGIMAFLL